MNFFDSKVSISLTGFTFVGDKNTLRAGQVNNIIFLSHYSSIGIAIDNIDNKTLVIDTKISSNTELLIEGHSNFKIIGSKDSFVDASIRINNSYNFSISVVS